MTADEMIVRGRIPVETIRSNPRGKLLDLADFALRLVQRVLIALLVAEFDERFHIVDALGGGVQTIQLRFRGGQPAGDLLGVSAVGGSYRVTRKFLIDSRCLLYFSMDTIHPFFKTSNCY